MVKGGNKKGKKKSRYIYYVLIDFFNTVFTNSKGIKFFYNKKNSFYK